MRLHWPLQTNARRRSCGLRSGYMRLHSTLGRSTPLVLWFAVRLYAITLKFFGYDECLGCGLRSGYMRLHSVWGSGQVSFVVVCGQAICDYTAQKKILKQLEVVVCGQAICDYTKLPTTDNNNSVVVCGQAICDYTHSSQVFQPLDCCGLRSGYMRLHSYYPRAPRSRCCGLRSGYMRLHYAVTTRYIWSCCGLRSGYMRLHFFIAYDKLAHVVVCGQAICDYTDSSRLPHPRRVVVCGQAICDYTGNIAPPADVQLWFAVRLYAITLLKNHRLQLATLWFAVRLYAITLPITGASMTSRLWFAVRLYAITLALI